MKQITNKDRARLAVAASFLYGTISFRFVFFLDRRNADQENSRNFKAEKPSTKMPAHRRVSKILASNSIQGQSATNNVIVSVSFSVPIYLSEASGNRKEPQILRKSRVVGWLCMTAFTCQFRFLLSSYHRVQDRTRFLRLSKGGSAVCFYQRVFVFLFPLLVTCFFF